MHQLENNVLDKRYPLHTHPSDNRQHHKATYVKPQHCSSQEQFIFEANHVSFSVHSAPPTISLESVSIMFPSTCPICMCGHSPRHVQSVSINKTSSMFTLVQGFHYFLENLLPQFLLHATFCCPSN